MWDKLQLCACGELQRDGFLLSTKPFLSLNSLSYFSFLFPFPFSSIPFLLLHFSSPGGGHSLPPPKKK